MVILTEVRTVLVSGRLGTEIADTSTTGLPEQPSELSGYTATIVGEVLVVRITHVTGQKVSRVLIFLKPTHYEAGSLLLHEISEACLTPLFIRETIVYVDGIPTLL